LKKTTILLLVVLLAITSCIYSQSYNFTHYQVENGLSNNAVICSLQDQQGFLWFGTKDGLNRFDGYSFKVFRNDPEHAGSIGGNFIIQLYEDKRGTLWVGSDKGLYQYDATTESFHLLQGTAGMEVRAIQEDATGNLWFIGDLILYEWQPTLRKLQAFNGPVYFNVSALCTSPDSTLWVASTHGTIEKYNPAHRTFTSYPVFNKSAPASSYGIEKIMATSEGSLLIGTSKQGVKRFDISTGTYEDILTYNADKIEIYVRDFIQRTDSEYWIATESGIFIYDLKNRQFTNLQKKYNDPYSISDNAIYTFCKDHEGGIWVGTYFGGVNYFPKQYASFEKFFPKAGENSLSGNAVREICPDKFGNLWIGTEDAGLNQLQLGTGNITSFTPNSTRTGHISNTNIHGLLAQGDTLWVGTFDHGLDVMNIKTGKVFRHYVAGTGEKALKSNFVYNIIHTSTGQTLFGTSRGLYSYNPATADFSIVTQVPDYIFYLTLFENKAGTVWTGTYRDGLYYFNPATGKKGRYLHDPANNTSISNNRVNRVFEDSNGHMWFATEDGLCQLNADQQTFKRYTTKNGLLSNVILGILEDDNKNLWISTSRGLACFSLSTEKIKVYTKANGLLSDQFNYNASYKDTTGRMYFGSVKGLISFKPADFIKSQFTPPVYITGFQVYNKELQINKGTPALKRSITFTDTITLAHDQSSFSIDFAALGYTSPETTEYAYKMDGLDNDWTNLETNRKAYFTKLSPGKYTFKVKAANSSGVWNDQPRTLRIEILPPIWAGIPAYFLYAMLLSMLVYYLLHSYHKRTSEKNKRQLQLFEHEKEKEIYQAKIQFFTNLAHEIRTPLTLIKGPMEKIIRKADEVPQIKNNLLIMERNTDRLLHLTNQLLDFRKTEIHDFYLSFVKTNIADALNEIYLSFKPAAEQKSLHFELNCPLPHLFAYVDTEAFNKMLSNLINNAIKYASNRVYIYLLPVAPDDGYFTILIKNDGYLIPAELKEKIFEPFYRIKETATQSGTGIGLPLARSLTLLHKGTLELYPTEQDLNIFALTLPIRQEIEFNLSR
jgi:ligand-binding sensor domain-containing protein/signal transduction histidine kinase